MSKPDAESVWDDGEVEYDLGELIEFATDTTIGQFYLRDGDVVQRQHDVNVHGQALFACRVDGKQALTFYASVGPFIHLPTYPGFEEAYQASIPKEPERGADESLDIRNDLLGHLSWEEVREKHVGVLDGGKSTGGGNSFLSRLARAFKVMRGA